MCHLSVHMQVDSAAAMTTACVDVNVYTIHLDLLSAKVTEIQSKHYLCFKMLCTQYLVIGVA